MGSDCGVPGLCNFDLGLICHKKIFNFCPVSLLFSSSFPHSNYFKLGPNYFRSEFQTICPHIFTFDNYLFERCFLFPIVSHLYAPNDNQSTKDSS